MYHVATQMVRNGLTRLGSDHADTCVLTITEIPCCSEGVIPMVRKFTATQSPRLKYILVPLWHEFVNAWSGKFEAWFPAWVFNFVYQLEQQHPAELLQLKRKEQACEGSRQEST